MYGIILKGGNRIGAVYGASNIPDGAIVVDTLPPGELCDYVWEDGEFIHDPLPKPDEPDPQPTQEERIAELEEELSAAKILLGLEV